MVLVVSYTKSAWDPDSLELFALDMIEFARLLCIDVKSGIVKQEIPTRVIMISRIDAIITMDSCAFFVSNMNRSPTSINGVIIATITEENVKL
ncbi:MAG: hypothetical protein HUJ51_02460 [Eggerthellaceae bacterium]|nr:hypothetical protein [Eggerthellaceae bacterium]